MRLETMSRLLRDRSYYRVPKAGAKLGMSRTESYEAAKVGLIPTERDGKLLLVPKRPWDRRVRRLLGKKHRKSK